MIRISRHALSASRSTSKPNSPPIWVNCIIPQPIRFCQKTLSSLPDLSSMPARRLSIAEPSSSESSRSLLDILGQHPSAFLHLIMLFQNSSERVGKITAVPVASDKLHLIINFSPNGLRSAIISPFILTNNFSTN